MIKALSDRKQHRREHQTVRVRRFAPKVQRFIRWYEKDGDRLIGEVELKGIKLLALQTLFGEVKSNPMYANYQIFPRQKPFLERFLGIPLQLDSYDYFVECSAA